MDLRRQRSRQFLWQAFFTLMTSEKQPFSTTTINQICEKALVHRSTFYAHFEDKYALLRYGFNQLWSDYLVLPKVDRALAPFKTAELFFSNSEASMLIHCQKSDQIFSDYSKQYFFELMKQDADQLNLESSVQLNLPGELFNDLYLSTLETLSDWADQTTPKPSPEQLDIWFNQILQTNFLTK